jgi:FAD/FMN-containing dehydrogenase
MPTSTSRSLTVFDVDNNKKTSQSKPKRLVKKVAKQTIVKSSKKPLSITTKSIKVHTTEVVEKQTPKNSEQNDTKNTVVKKAKSKAVKTTIKSSGSDKFILPAKKIGLDSKKSFAKLRREPLAHLLIEKNLRKSGFRGGISTNSDYLDLYSYDESIFSIRPQIVIQPHDQTDVEIAVKVIAQNTENYPSLSLTARAAGTGLSGGSLTDSIVIDMCSHMNTLIKIDQKKSVTTFTCQPGLMWRDLEKALKVHGQYLPPFPASKDICSIGGAVANNAAGPDSLRYGHCADWVASLKITLFDGVTYDIKPLSYKEFKTLIKKNNAHAKIARDVFDLIKKNEKTIQNARPHTKKNSAGYALWDMIDGSVAEFEKGKASFDLTRLISGSQGTIGIVTEITMRSQAIPTNTSLIALPIFSLDEASKVILKALEYKPLNIEMFDGLTFDLALKNPNFFRNRLSGANYYRVLLSMYTLFHVRYHRKTPEFTLLITLDEASEKTPENVVSEIKKTTLAKAKLVKNPAESEMYWQIRRASYTLSKLQDKTKRPAAFLEDMTVPPKNLPRFFAEIKKLLKKYNVKAAVHGHGGNGHLHFYPLLDFTNKSTPDLIEKMSEEFFNTAIKYDGNICGEHNDGIIRTPHLSKVFNKATLDLFKKVEHIFDPKDIFNPGKKVNPRFDIKDSLRKIN